jgi:hypothetical protein
VIYAVTVGRPRWARFSILAWVARVAGIDRRWVARGRDVPEMLANLRDLATRRGLRFVDDGGVIYLTAREGHSVAIEAMTSHRGRGLFEV